MSLKSKIISRLDTIQDQETLKEIHDWLDAFLEADTKETFESGEIKAVQEGYEQYLSGSTVSQKEASKVFEEWLSRKER
ncbi:hypothetical protein [Cecembia lonarensis]|uniref:Addiction module component n=1 Tax=Cecembia lonarensis (strain CCUG 58316 / KCTC 22772 / LW9) TaxID=1225176 RepID=K1LUM7_CECL9|nr:hypothetical protein [Cecembia lonarensis]EKB47819.1 hypothetical protein B879_03575 [Cecembia lonarensis LW9]